MPTQIPRKPIVAIVGQPNVGKSAIFNRFAGRRISIVHDQPGVTRDRLSVTCTRGPIPFEVVDTGGIGATLDDGFAQQVRMEADIAIVSADLILFVVDAAQGLTPIDQELASVLRKSSVPVLLIVNKVDHDKHESLVNDFAGLGFDNPFPISAEHGRNMDGLYRYVGNRLIKRFGTPDEEDSAAEVDAESGEALPAIPPTCIAIVGRPNVGKSSLINAVLDDERTIVSDVAGTTRDAVDVPYEREGRKYNLIDTAGIRRKTKVDTPVEVFSVMRSERSIRRADLCLLVIDAAQGVSAMDRKIAQTILKEHKPCIVILNKFDLFHPDAKYRDRIEELQEHMQQELFFLDYAPMVATSALKGQHVKKIFEAIDLVHEAAADMISTGELNRLLKMAVERTPPPARQGKRLNLLYATMKRSDRPRAIDAPLVMLFANYANLIPRTYQRYLEGVIRKERPWHGLPINFVVKSRKRTD